MTPLAHRLGRIAAAEGSVSVARFMAEVLSADHDAYYRTGDPLGETGDFVTAPEISQMFGELLGLWCVATWQAMGCPSPLRLVELGPGRGTLMADALRAARLAPEFLAAADLHLVEISAGLRAIQASALAEHSPTWHVDVSSLPAGPRLVLANEFFDALPVHQFVRRNGGWRERCISFADGIPRWADMPRGGADDQATDGLPPAAIASDGAIIETAPLAAAIAGELSADIARYGGAMLVIDYGHDGTVNDGDSFQALRRHAFVDPLDSPGSADLTAHVPFGALARRAADAGARPWPLVSQGDFLRTLGIETRLEALVRRADGESANALDAACRRLIHPDEMGTLFKVLAITDPDVPAPAGFEGLR